jgi:hypothetical protein
MNNEEVQKIIEQIRKVQSNIPGQDLEQAAKNIYDLALFIVQLHSRQHIRAPKTGKEEDYGQETSRAP